MRATVLLCFGLAGVAAGLSTNWLMAAETIPHAIRPGLDAISGDALLSNIKVLASSEFEGRAPATPGEEKTVNWLAEQFRALGLRPGNPNGSWFQDVPMVGMTVAEPSVSFLVDGQRTALAFPTDCVIWSRRQVPEIKIEDSEVLFAGYGVVAPEYGWDDFKDVDVRGKTILVLINDPQVPDAREPDQLDPAMFKGRAMTYYGRWTYKFDMAAKKGAAAAIIVHQEKLAGYPWGVVQDSNSRENFQLQAPDRDLGKAAIEGWITHDSAGRLCAAAGFDLEALEKRALNRDFKPEALGVKASIFLKNKIRQVVSRNVIARLEGSSHSLRNEFVIYTAHWDHLGLDPKLAGDPVYHGALDNASGVAGLLELARAFHALHSPPKRTLLFLSVTAEEKGLLGSRYYALHPLYPIAKTVADLNMDVLNPWGRTSDLEIIGQGNSSLEGLLTLDAATQGRVIEPEAKPERGSFYRSDHFEFAKVGVPVLYFKSGTNYIGKPVEFGVQKTEEYVKHDYHKPSDNIKSDWDFSGAVEDLKLLFQVGWTIAERDERPGWLAGSEFRAGTTNKFLP